MTRPLSVVIPTLNEADRLPRLLDCLAAQTHPPDEIIVADAGSTDSTREVAASRGASVVEGGLPGAGRNAGARAATGDVILFLDADVELPDTFIGLAESEFESRGLAVATAPPEPLEEKVPYVVACGVMNLYMRSLQQVSPHAVGFCILVWRDVHERIGGFDETVLMAEDHDYARRASRVGRFGVLNTVSVPVSMRRIEKEGFLRLARMCFHTERLTLAGKPVRDVPFVYEFGAHDGTRTPRRVGRVVRELAKPSTEVQADAIVTQVVAGLAGVAGTTSLTALGLPVSTRLALAGTAAAVVVLATCEALWKLRFERHYGDFFMSSVCVASDDVVDDDGRVLARRGVDEVCEVHVIGSLRKMSTLSRQGAPGRLAIMLESLEGMRSMLDDMDDPLYSNVRLVTARSDLVGTLFKIGFDEVHAPPRYDLPNRIQKRLVLRFVSMWVGRDRSGGLQREKLAVMPMDELRGDAFRCALEHHIQRIRRDLARATRRSLAATAI